MASLPYITSPGNISKALEAIQKASVPDKVSGDFVKTVLKIPGGSGDQVTTFLKKIGFADSSGAPSARYTKFRNPTSSGAMVADAVRDAYSALYIRNEYMHELSDDELVGLIVEETGNAHDSNSVKLTAKSIMALKQYADFEAEEASIEPEVSIETKPFIGNSKPPNLEPTSLSKHSEISKSIGLNLGYTINLHLPPTTDIAVFDAIFTSLKNNLMTDDDA